MSVAAAKEPRSNKGALEQRNPGALEQTSVKPVSNQCLGAFRGAPTVGGKDRGTWHLRWPTRAVDGVGNEGIPFLGRHPNVGVTCQALMNRQLTASPARPMSPSPITEASHLFHQLFHQLTTRISHF